MTQDTIGQRIKFLIETQKLSVRKFAQMLDLSEATIRNYFDRGTKPSSDFFEKLDTNFPLFNLTWLITGRGQPFLSDTPTLANESNATYAPTDKNFSHSQVISGKGHKAASQQQSSMPADVAALQRENELLKAQLADKERTIQILLTHQAK